MRDSDSNSVATEMPDVAKARLMILCWGYSIHARRRVQLFIDDPRFEVAVVSTYDYGFNGARFFPLSQAIGASTVEAERQASGRSLRDLVPPGVVEVLRKCYRVAGLPVELWRAYRDYRILRRAVIEFKPDLVFLQTLMYPCYLSYLLPRKIPFIVTFWNGDVTHFAKWTGLEMIAKRWLVKYGIKRANQITCNSRTAYDACLALGAREERLALIRYPAADVLRFARRNSENAKRNLGIGGMRVVLCPRGLGAFFNSEVIIDAIPKVAAVVPNVLFLFISGVGGLQQWQIHSARAERLGVAHCIRWDGQVPWEEMPDYYSAADVMVSIMTADSCPNCMLEAMASEVPVVMSDTRQNREWIADGENGYLIEPSDHDMLASRIVNLLANVENRAGVFSSRSLELVTQNGNAAVNVPRIKQLVLGIAGKPNVSADAT